VSKNPQGVKTKRTVCANYSLLSKHVKRGKLSVYNNTFSLPNEINYYINKSK